MGGETRSDLSRLFIVANQPLLLAVVSSDEWRYFGSARYGRQSHVIESTLPLHACF